MADKPFHDPITEKIIGAALAVHRGLGPGFEEVLYQRALALELDARGLDQGREIWMDIHYRGQIVGKKRVDFIVEHVMVEIKAKSALEDRDFMQTLSYLRASSYRVGSLLNFGDKLLGIKRLLNGWDPSQDR